ncbi:MAG: LPS export ABC transporter permease LptF [Proteobacteria bacterium]|nr:LPS export ABC transporter permease LptF [Pseudomonadota bacterium]
MTKKLNLYIAREITVPFLLGLTIFTCILLMGKVLNLTELVVGKGVAISEVLRLILYILPTFFVYTIPMAFLLGVLLAFGRLSNDEEITSMKASGISLIQLMPPVAFLALVMLIISLFLMIFALPWGSQGFKAQTYGIAKQKADTAIVPGRLIDSFKNIVLHINGKDRLSGRFTEVMISEEKKGLSSNTILAKEGEIIALPERKTITLRLYDGTIHRRGLKKDTQYKAVDFKIYDIALAMGGGKNDKGIVKKSEKELSVSEILQKSKELKEMGKNDATLKIELHKRFAIPFACIVFALIGAPLGIQGKRSGKAHGFIISLALIITYWISFLLGEAIGERNIMPPSLSIWTPNIVFFAIGLYLMNKVNADKEIKLMTLFEQLFSLIVKTAKGLIKVNRGKKQA